MDSNSRTTITCKRGRKYAQAVVLDGTVDVRELPIEAWWKPEQHGLRPLTPFDGKDVPYPVDWAALRLLEAGNHVGITERARRLLIPLLGVPRNLEVDIVNTTESTAQ